MDLVLMIAAFGAIMYFLMIRPQQKRMKEQQALINSLAAGARVLLTSGMFATILHMGERQVIVELAPGVDVTILKGNIARIVAAEEEEFEFSDDAVEISADGLRPSDFLDQQPDEAEFDPRPAELDDPKNED